MEYERYKEAPKQTFELALDRRKIKNDLPAVIKAVTARHSNLGSKILEIGADTGYYKDHVVFPPTDPYVTTDINLESLRDGMRERPLEVVVADAQCLPFRDASFGTVIAADVFDIVGDMNAAFSESVRVLEDGGKLLVFGANYPAPHILDVPHPVLASSRLQHYLNVLNKKAYEMGLTVFESGLVSAALARQGLQKSQTDKQLENAEKIFNPELYARERQLKESSTMLLFVAGKV